MPYHFVDESGNLGFAFEAGSSKTFVLVVLRVSDPETLRVWARNLRLQQSLPASYEFKYRRVGSRRVLRQAFFAGLAQLGFMARALVVDKTKLAPGLMALDRVGFYGWALGEILAVMPAEEITDAVLVLDEPVRSGKFITSLRVHLSRVLRGLGQRAVFRKITGHDSARDGGLQCADMIAGALADHISGDDSSAYLQIVSKFATILYRP